MSVEHGAPIGFFSDREELALIERELGLKQRKRRRKDPDDFEGRITEVYDYVTDEWVSSKVWDQRWDERHGLVRKRRKTRKKREKRIGT